MKEATIDAAGGRVFRGEVIGWKRERGTVLLVKVPMNGVYEFCAKTGKGQGRAGKIGMSLSASSSAEAKEFGIKHGRVFG